MVWRGTPYMVLLLIPLAAQPAFAVLLFQDDFLIDPELNGWTEISSPALTGTISPFAPQHAGHGDEIIFKKNLNDGIPVFLSITREVSTLGFENIQLSLTAHQQSAAALEPADFLEISVDTNNDGIFESVLKDVEVWDGIQDTSVVDSGAPSNFVPTSTDFLPLSDDAENNPNLKIRIEARFEGFAEEYFLTEFEVIGDTTPSGSDNDGDGIDNTSDNCPDIPNPGQEDNDGNGIGNACDTMDISIIILDAINQIITLLLNPNFGLEEIKTEVAIIETEVLHDTHGLAAIKTTVDNIDGKAGEIPSETQTQIDNIETETNKIQMLKDDVAMLKSQLINMEEKIDKLIEAIPPPFTEKECDKFQEIADKAIEKGKEIPPDIIENLEICAELYP